VQSDVKQPALIAAFAAIYLVWGSTYLAIRIGLETLPPFLLAGARFVLAGTVLYLWLRLRGVPRPTDSQWWWAAVTGTLMLVCGVGGVTWAEQEVPSGPAALLVATVPLWMTLIDGTGLRRGPVGWRTVTGLVLGLAGVVVLIDPSRHALSTVNTVGGVVILASALCWSLGSLQSRRCNLPSSPAMTAAVQMVTGGVALLIVSSALREWQDGFALAEVSLRSAAALAYLAVVGSLVALCAYVWLLRRVSAPAVATYAFVNPVVAVFLGWGLAGESVGPRIALASALMVGAVVLIQSTLWRQVDAKSFPAPCPAPTSARVARVQPALAHVARSPVFAEALDGFRTSGEAALVLAGPESDNDPCGGSSTGVAGDGVSAARIAECERP
jgi:drug/metabolite transporter (DMT)-like permease